MPQSEVKTMILRFRDLACDIGGTIQKHNDICQGSGYVWWGWWNKTGETVPDDVFRQLKAVARGDGLEVLLADSGQGFLYKAKCIDIDWDILHVKKISPDPTFTPDYYKQTEYLAWFKFESIDTTSLSEGVLKGYTYCKVDEFFVNRPSKYTSFYGKVVYSLNELRQQDRTIWFVRDFINGADGEQEISLLDPMTFSPEHFSKQFINTASINLLWVSDLHYSEDGNHAYPIEASVDNQPLGINIEQVLSHNHINNIAGLIVSGDISWKASNGEFEQAKSLFTWAHSWGKLQPYQFAICPGNHDVAFTDVPYKKEKKAEIGIATPRSREAYNNFYKQLFYLNANEFLSCGRRLLLGGAVPVEIVCLNSSFLEQYKGKFQGQGFVSQRQRDNAASEMGWDNADNNLSKPFRIVVLHHHVLPVTYSEGAQYGAVYSVTLDAEALTQWAIANKVNLILHGHMHEPFYSKIERPITLSRANEGQFTLHIAGMGSTGVKASHVGDTRYNTFGVLTFLKNKLEINYYKFDGKSIKDKISTIEIPYV